MKLFTGKLLAGLFSLAIVVSCLGGCAKETADKKPAAKADPGSSTGPSGVSVPGPDAPKEEAK